MQLDIKIVGRAVFSHEVVQDDIDTGLDGNVVFTPALTRRLSRCCASFTWSALRLDGHAQSHGTSGWCSAVMSASWAWRA